MIKHIIYKEQEYPIKVGYFTIKMLKAEKNKDIEDIFMENTDLEIFETLLYYALMQGCKYINVPFETIPSNPDEKPEPITKDMMVDFLDDCFFEFVELIPAFFPTLLKKTAQPVVAKKRGKN